MKAKKQNKVTRLVKRISKKERIINCVIGKNSYILSANISDLTWYKQKHYVNNLQIGNYTAIGNDCNFIIDNNHDYNSVYMNSISLYENKGIELEKLGVIKRRIKRKGQIIIGNDVWIGDNVTILSGVVINNGAVVVANSLVASDVPPYSIVAGNPARVIKYRFSKDVIIKFQMIKWWYWSDEQLLKAENNMKGDPKVFVEKYIKSACLLSKKEKEKNREIISKHIKCNDSDILLLYLSDLCNEEHPVIYNVLDNYSKVSIKDVSKLIIVYFGDDDKERIKQLVKSEYPSIINNIFLLDANKNNIELIIGAMDYFITNRRIETIKYWDYASTYGVKVLSGVDIPIF